MGKVVQFDTRQRLKLAHGLADIEDAIAALHSAVDYLDKAGYDDQAQDCAALCEMLVEQRSGLPGGRNTPRAA